MTNEMILRVAKAIKDCRDSLGSRDYISQARSAIWAMIEPTDKMLDAGAIAYDMTLEYQYKNMIEAALKED